MKLIKPTMLFIILFSLFFTNISHADVSEKNYSVSNTDAKKKYELGMMYSSGLGGEKDDKKAFFWFSQAAQQGNVDAQLRLGMIYILGRGIPKDDKKAFEWINKAAEKNNADAQYFLGSMYQSGEGVAKDKRKALEWLNKSAQQGNEKAIEELKNY
jgi:TPR repeat protein